MLSGPVDPSFRALSGRLQFTVRRRKFNTDYLFLQGGADIAIGEPPATHPRPGCLRILVYMVIYDSG